MLETFSKSPVLAIFPEFFSSLLGHGRVLDVGCGDGRHSLLFAKRGFEVTAVDISTIGLQKLKHRADKLGVKIAIYKEDIGRFSPDGKYDLIIAHGVLHLLLRSEADRVIEQFRQSTRPGGYNVAVAITDLIPVPESARNIICGPFPNGELCRAYGDWHILLDEEYVMPETETIHYRRHFNRVVSRSPE